MDAPNDAIVAPKPLRIMPALPVAICSQTLSCPPTPKGILRSKCSPTGSSSSSCRSCSRVRFSEAIDQHTADDYDRSKCATATPTFREIRELERIRRELCPDGRGITDYDDEQPSNSNSNSEPGEMCFSFDDGCDVDPAPAPRPSRMGTGGRRLRNVPIELCPILAVAPTPCNSHSPSPLSSPGGSPMLGPVKEGARPRIPAGRFGTKPQPTRARMSFLPILPPSDPPMPAPPILTPPETPTMLKLDLNDAAAPTTTPASAAAPTPVPVPPRPASAPHETTTSSSPASSASPTNGYALQLSSSPSRPRPQTCRMTILPINPKHETAAVPIPPAPTPVIASTGANKLVATGRPYMAFMPVNVPTMTAART